MARKLTGFVVAAVATFAALAVPGSAAEGDLDTTFNGDGIVEENPSAGFDVGIDVAVDEDGNVVVAGRAGGSGGRMFVARYATDGTLDPTFSGDGRAYVNFTPGDDAAIAMAVHGDGRVVLAGAGDNLRQIAMARLNADGTLDGSFSGDGKATFDLRGGGTLEIAEGLIITEAGGYRLTGGLGRFAAVIGVNQAGILDTTWSGDGQLTVPFSSTQNAFGSSIAEGPGGTITIAGAITGAGASANRTIIARFLVGGAPDNSFSGDGRNSVSVIDGYEDATALVVLDDGSTITAGEANGQLSVLKWQSGGPLDPAFSGDGKVRINLAGGPEWISDLRRQDDGALVVAGRMAGAGGRGFVMRLNDAGARDNTFSGDGLVPIDRTPQNEWLRAVELDGDGHIIAAGGAADDGRVLTVRLEGAPPN